MLRLGFVLHLFIGSTLAGIGVIAALVPIVLLRDRLLASIPVRLIRGAGAAILLLTGGIMAITALGLL